MNPRKVNPFLVEKVTSGSDCTTWRALASRRGTPLNGATHDGTGPSRSSPDLARWQSERRQSFDSRRDGGGVYIQRRDLRGNDDDTAGFGGFCSRLQLKRRPYQLFC